MSSTTNDSVLLKKLAISMVDNPRSTIKELAEAVDISKATLHRFCGTRENLDKLLYNKAMEAFDSIIAVAKKEFDSYKLGLRELVNVHLENQELLRFFCGIQMSTNGTAWEPYMDSIDSFFLRGQKKGDFKVELSTTFLSEMFIMTICGVIDSVRYGRIASIGVEKDFEEFFLHGSQKIII